MLAGAAETISAWCVEIEERAEALGSFAADCFSVPKYDWACSMPISWETFSFRRFAFETQYLFVCCNDFRFMLVWSPNDQAKTV